MPLFPRRRADVSAIIWHGAPEALLTFLVDEGMCTQAFLQTAMDQYNASVADDVLMRPYASLEEFIADKGVLSKIAQAYNRTANGEFASYEEAWKVIAIAPSRPPRRTMREALERQAQRRNSDVRRVIEG